MSGFNQPLGGNEMPRFAGPATMMRLPSQASARELGACFVGVPIDIGASNRSGTRHGPRQIRAESCMIRPYNMATRAMPFDSFQVADLGDIAINTFDLKKSVGLIEKAYDGILADDCVPLTLGGDHTLTLPILRAMKKKHGPVALIHVDAHADINDEMFGEKIAHGTPFRRAVEEGLARLRQGFSDRPSRIWLFAGRFRLAAAPGVHRGRSGEVLVQIHGTAHGGSPRQDRRSPGLSHL